MTLAAFLLARIQEDEAEARSLIYYYPHALDEEGGYQTDSENLLIWVSAQRVLAECEAKRRIIGVVSEGCECHASGTTLGNANWDLQILKALALPYADDPDYQQEWAL